MSRIDSLIRDLCPDGVEVRTLEEIFETRNGYTPSKNDVEAWAGSDVPWFRMDDIRSHGRILQDATQRISKSAVKGSRTFPADSILVATSATIGEHALVRVPHLSNQRFTNLTVKDSFRDSLEIKFLFYYCFKLDEWCLKNTTTSSFSSVNMKAFKKFKFPIPPLEVQQEISRTLDQFTQLEAELEAELEARRRQFTYFRNLIVSGSQQAQLVPIKDIGKLQRGRRFTRNDMVGEGIPAIHYGEIYTTYGCKTDSTVSFVKDEIEPQLRFAQPGDIIIAAVGETVADVGTGVAWLGTTPVAYHDDSFALHHDQNPRYISHSLRTSEYHRQKDRFVSRAKVKRLSAKGIEQIQIPLPPLDEQRRIANILDDFDALVNDLNSGLPAEIEARRKQYEYYRDRLLTFPEKK